MGNRVAYFGNVRLGTHLVGIDPLHERGGQGVVLGIDRGRAWVERKSPNFLYRWRVWTQEYEAAPAARSEVGLQKAILDEFAALETMSDDNRLRPLVWIEDDAKATTISGAVSAGSAVDVEVASLAALGAAAGDYVHIVGETDAWCCLVASTGTGPDRVVLDLPAGLAGGETVLLATICYPESRYDGQDPGQKQPYKLNRVSFRKSYTFTSGRPPMWKA